MVRRVCDRKVMLNDGRTIPAGAPFEVTKEEAEGLEEAGYNLRKAGSDSAEETDAGPAENKVAEPKETKPARNARRGDA